MAGRIRRERYDTGFFAMLLKQCLFMRWNRRSPGTNPTRLCPLPIDEKMMRFATFSASVLFAVTIMVLVPAVHAAATGNDTATDPNALFTRGELDIYSGKYEDALATFDTLLAILPPDAKYRDFTVVDIWAYKGEAYAGLNRTGEALAAYDKALSLDPDDTDSWNAKEKLLRSMNRTADADLAEERMRAAAQKENEAFDKAAFPEPVATKSGPSSFLPIASLCLAGAAAAYAGRRT